MFELNGCTPPKCIELSDYTKRKTDGDSYNNNNNDDDDDADAAAADDNNNYYLFIYKFI